MIAQGTKPGIRLNALRIAEPTVGSPPVSRSCAPATKAPLKKTLITLRPKAATIATIAMAGLAVVSSVVPESVLAKANAANTSGINNAAETRNDKTGIASNSRSLLKHPPREFCQFKRVANPAHSRSFCSVCFSRSSLPPA